MGVGNVHVGVGLNNNPKINKQLLVIVMVSRKGGKWETSQTVN